MPMPGEFGTMQIGGKLTIEVRRSHPWYTYHPRLMRVLRILHLYREQQTPPKDHPSD
jgi:hypothetical protein